MTTEKEKMIRKNFHWRKDQMEAITSLPGNASDHIRTALDDYIVKINRKNVAASSSGKGEKHD